MYQPNDPVGISVQMSAKLFAIMADEVLQACGEDKGEEIVRRAVRRYAELRAAGIRKEILDAGKEVTFATVYKGNIIKNLIMDCQSYTKYRPNETMGGIFVSWRRKEELPTGA